MKCMRLLKNWLIITLSISMIFNTFVSYADTIDKNTCQHDYQIDYAIVNAEGHSLVCSKCHTAKVVKHTFANTYNGIHNNQCYCGFNKKVNVMITSVDGESLYSDQIDSFSNLIIDSSKFYTDEYNQNEYKVSYFDQYEYIPDHNDYSNTHYDWQLIATISTLPDKVNNVSVIFIPHYKITNSSAIKPISGINLMGNKINNDIFNDDNSDVTTLDLSENIIDPPEHIHRYVTAYDANKDGYHYQKCSICGIINETTKVKHTFTETWRYPNKHHCGDIYSVNVCECVCSCGYFYMWRENHQYPPNNVSERTDDFQFVHDLGNCLICGYSEGNYEYCYVHINGEKKLIRNLDHDHDYTCEVCGHTYKKGRHEFTINGTKTEGICPCGKKVRTHVDVEEKITKNGKEGIHQKITITPYDSGDTISATSLLDYWNGQSSFERVDSTFSSNNNTVIYDTTFVLKDNAADLLGDAGQRCTIMLYSGHKSSNNFFINGVQSAIITLSNDNYYFSLDKQAPQVSDTNISISDIQKKIDTSGKEWIILQTFNINGTDNLSKSVSLDIFATINGAKKIFYSGRVNVDNSTRKFNFNITPNIEIQNPINLTFYFTDNAGNTTTITKQINPSDNSAPVFKNSDDYTNQWTKVKNITIDTEDNGSGNVKITLNNKNDFTYGIKNGNRFTKTYKITGDVYNEINPIAYAVDDLDNLSYQTLKVNKIDNTNPTIENVEQIKNGYGSSIITIKGNDKHAIKGTGSGVSHYAVVKKGKVPSDSDFNIVATQDTTDTNLFISTKELVFYGDYDVYAKDLVGNISNAYETNVDVDIKYNIKCEYMQERATKSYIINDVVLGVESNLPVIKSLPSYNNSFWKFNDNVVNTSKDLDKYVTENNQTITITCDANNVYINNDINNLIYNIKCEYMQEKATKSIIINDVHFGDNLDLPKLKVLPITSKVFGWFYNDTIVYSTNDIDKFVNYNGETITIKFITENGDKDSCYIIDDLSSLKYNLVCEYYQEKATKSIIINNIHLGDNQKLPVLKTLPPTAKVYGWYFEDSKVNTTNDIDKYVFYDGAIITIKYLTENNASSYTDDILFKYKIRYLYNDFSNGNKEFITDNIIIDEDVRLLNISSFTNGYDKKDGSKNWYCNNRVVSKTSDVAKFVSYNNEIIDVTFKYEAPKKYGSGGGGGNIISSNGLNNEDPNNSMLLDYNNLDLFIVKEYVPFVKKAIQKNPNYLDDLNKIKIQGFSLTEQDLMKNFTDEEIEEIYLQQNNLSYLTIETLTNTQKARLFFMQHKIAIIGSFLLIILIIVVFVLWRKGNYHF